MRPYDNIKLALDTDGATRPMPPHGGFKQIWEGGTPIISYGDTLPTSYVGEDPIMPDLDLPRPFDENGWKSYSKMMSPEEYASRFNRLISLGRREGFGPGAEDYMSQQYFIEKHAPWNPSIRYDEIQDIKEKRTWADYLQRTTPTMQSNPQKPKAAKPEAAKPEAAKPEAAKPEAAKPEAAKPEAAKPEAAESSDAYGYGQRFGNFARNPTENNTVNYGILGGVGALGAGGLAYLLSSPENRKRNALIFALLGGGAGLAGKYYADKGFAPQQQQR